MHAHSFHVVLNKCMVCSELLIKTMDMTNNEMKCSATAGGGIFPKFTNFFCKKHARHI